MARKQRFLGSPGTTATLGSAFVALGLFGVFFGAPAVWAGVAWLAVGVAYLVIAHRDNESFKQEQP
jgi:hypothetical protein